MRSPSNRRISDEIKIENAKEILESNSCNYIGSEYEDSKLIIKLNCHIHGESKRQFIKIKQKNTACVECTVEKRRLKARDGLEKTQFLVDKDGRYVFLGIFYHKAKLPEIALYCPLHGKFKMRYGNFKNGAGCATCGQLSANAKLKIIVKDAYDSGARQKPVGQFKRNSEVDVVNWIKNNTKYELVLPILYKNANSKINLICQKHGIFVKTLDKLKAGSGCNECGKERVGILNSVSFFELEFRLKDQGLTVVSREIDKNKEVKVKCQYHGEFLITATLLEARKKACLGCSRDEWIVSLVTPIEEVEEWLSLNSIFAIVKDSYKKASENATFVCPKHGEFESSFVAIKRGTSDGCRCGEKTTEKECRNILINLLKKEFNSIHPDWIRNPKTNFPLELDCYNEDLKLALEYNGEQHYMLTYYAKTQEKLDGIRERDLFKAKRCAEEGVSLIIVPFYVEDKEMFIKTELDKLGIKYDT